MKPRWRKVIHDLLDNKGRTLLVVLSIAVGVFSIGVIAGAYQIIANDMSVSYSANRPANVELRMTDFDEEILEMIHNQRGVEDAEGRRVFNIRVRAPGTEKWTTLDMIAFEDFEENGINLLIPIAGQPKPEKREVLLEQDVLEHIDSGMGELLEFQLPDGSTKTLPVVGIVQDTAASAGDFLASPSAYISMDTLELLRKYRVQLPQQVKSLEALDELKRVRERADELEVTRVRYARTWNLPWTKIADALGVDATSLRLRMRSHDIY